MINYNSSPRTTVKKTVTENEYDEKGNLVKETITETVTTTESYPNYGQIYNQPLGGIRYTSSDDQYHAYFSSDTEK